MTGYRPPLQVVEFIATRLTDAERGPMVKIRSDDAKMRMIEDGHLVWVHGPRRHELASVVVDDSLTRGGILVRDIAGLAPSEIVTLERVERGELKPRKFK
jgi:anaerobic selenocysteine-containing dehydrogenase